MATTFPRLRSSLSAAIVLSIMAIAYFVHVSGNATLSLSIMLGLAFGIVLQRARFCFFCNFRDWYEDGDPRGLWGIIVAIAVGAIGYSIVFGAWLPDPSTGRLPPDAFIGPVTPVLILAGLVFGAGMTISGSCLSAHLYRLGEGSATAPFALVGSVAGFILGLLCWNWFYLFAIGRGPAVWLPFYLGYAGTLVVTLFILGLIAVLLGRRMKMAAQTTGNPGIVQQVLKDRWPAWAGGVLVGLIAMIAYLRVAPLGVTAEISRLARDVGAGADLLPSRLEGIDTLRGCISLVRDAALSNNGGFVLSLVLASFAAALTADLFRPSWPTPAQAVRGLSGGVLLGWGATIGLGCTVGTLLSGIMAGALSGWVFGASVFAGVTIALWIGLGARRVSPV